MTPEPILSEPKGTVVGPIKAADLEALVTTNPAFCLAPWVHLHVQAEGHVTPCCESRERLGNINKERFASIWDGDKMRDLRARMLRGEKIASCRHCYDREGGGVESLRNQYNARQHLFENVIGGQSDGSAPNAKPVRWDVRFSNICNFRCRSCWHGASSRWFADGKAIGVTAGDQAIIHGVEDADSLFEQLETFMPDVEELYFAGGEPLIMEEHYRLLDEFVARGFTNVALSYNTNLSVTGYKGRDVIELWRKFPNVVVHGSVDAIGARGELMRKDQDWAETVANVRRIRRECPHIRFVTETTVSILNVQHVPDMMRALLDLEIVSVEEMRFHLLQDPGHLNIRVLPKKVKAAVRKTYTKLMAELFGRSAPMPAQRAGIAGPREQLSETLDYMDSEDWTHLLPKFEATTRELDRLRGESTRKIFPELARVLDIGARMNTPTLWKRIQRRAKRESKRLFSAPSV